MPATRNIAIAAALVLCAAGASAQQRPEPNLMLSLFGGLTTGTGLWEINRQPLTVRGTEPAPKYDSLRISRRLEPGLVLGASGAIFPSPALGFTAEITLLSLPISDDCTMAFHNAGSDLLERNQQLCANLGASAGAATTVAATVGAVLRAEPRGAISPYVRAQVGVGIRNASTMEVTSGYLDFDGSPSNPFVLVLDAGRSRSFVTGAVAGGLMIPYTPGYQIRLEVRDNLVFLDRITGPASNVAVAPSERYMQHTFAFLIGLDVVLEQRRGRRY